MLLPKENMADSHGSHFGMHVSSLARTLTRMSARMACSCTLACMASSCMLACSACSCMLACMACSCNLARVACRFSRPAHNLQPI